MLTVIKETGRSFMKSLFFNLILIAQLAICFWLFSLLLNNFFTMGYEKLNQDYAVGDDMYYYAAISSVGDNSEEFYRDAQAFVEDLYQQTDFTYMKFDLADFTSMRMDVWNNQVSGQDYKRRGATPRGVDPNEALNENQEAEEANTESTADHQWVDIKDCILDFASFQHFPLQYIAGHGPAEEDFILHKGQDTIPIVLGYEYRDDFQIGDKIPLKLVEMPLYGEVVGILEQHSYTYLNAVDVANIEYAYLDDSIILPYLMFDYWATEDHPEEYWTQVNLLTNQYNGYLVTPKDADPLQVSRTYRAICDKLSMSRFAISLTAETSGMRMFAGENQQSIRVIVVLVIAMGIFCVFILITNMLAKIDRNIRTYLIQMTNGASIWHIITQYILEMILVVIPACIISGILLKKELLISYQFLVIIVSLSLLCLGISAFMISMKLANLKTDELLRRKE